MEIFSTAPLWKGNTVKEQRQSDILDTAPSVLTVSALNGAVARMLERSFPLAWISGEISNFTRAASGHWYFTLKDEGAQVRAVMFRGRAQYAGFMPREGDRVEVRALVTLYAPRGDYQLNVEAIRRSGTGNLYEAFLELKARLSAEGLFDPARKRPIPAYARSIGIVTSLQAAALRDVLSTLRRRAPHVNIILYPTPVQGDAAVPKIAQAIATASLRAECDVLLVCRGGGSIEDLWCFNHEAVARAIAGCTMPVISGVGHETDVTIADFAADLRAPTPTAAAELATTPRADWLAQLEAHADDLTRAWKRSYADASQSLDWLARRLLSPAERVARERLKLDAMKLRLAHATRSPLSLARFAVAQLDTRLKAQLPDIDARRGRLVSQARQLHSGMSCLLRERRQALAGLSAQLELLNPQRTLERGYAIVIDAKGRTVRTPAGLHARENITMHLAEGSVEAMLAAVQPRLD
jgi:exodeoxyribonuclease VII large subunit